MKSIQDIAAHSGQEYTIMTFDQAIYKAAKKIQWKSPVEFEQVVICMGDFTLYSTTSAQSAR
jgi:hypothetical protein